MRVRGHDRARCVRTAGNGERIDRRGQPRLEQLDAQRLANHAGRGNQHLFALAAQDLRGDLARLGSDRATLLARGGVGVAGVDDNTLYQTVALFRTA